jgi:hypothetical protein
MPKTVTVDVRVLDLPQVQRVNASVAALLEALGECAGLPEPVTLAMERLWRDVEALSPADSGVPDREAVRQAEEDAIRRVTAEAMEHPGRIVRVDDLPDRADGHG